MKMINVIEVKVEATMGSNIGQCLRESIEIAILEWRNVRLTFNGRDYLIQPNELLASVSENVSKLDEKVKS